MDRPLYEDRMIDVIDVPLMRVVERNALFHTPVERALFWLVLDLIKIFPNLSIWAPRPAREVK